MIPLNMGIGFGIPYGVLGLNAEWRLGKKLDLAIGAGGTGPTAGLHFYPNPSHPKLRLSIVYGIVKVLKVEDCSSQGYYYSSDFCNTDFEDFTGFAFAIGLGSRDKSGWTADFYPLALAPEFKDRSDELEEQGYEVTEDKSATLFSVGYHWAF